MIGAIAGDIVGSIYEGRCLGTKDFDLFSSASRFTDDSVLTIAVADALLSSSDYAALYKTYCRRYPNAGYGANFHAWAFSESTAPYNSYGNGAPMRVSPVAYAFDTLDTVVDQARRSAMPTHNHPEAVRGASAIAAAIFLGRTGTSKADIKAYIEGTFSYALDSPYQTVAPADVSSQNSVPQAFAAFLGATSVEDAIRNAVYIGGDTDTLACMAGAMAEAFYGGVPGEIESQVRQRLDANLLAVIDGFEHRFKRRAVT